MTRRTRKAHQQVVTIRYVVHADQNFHQSTTALLNLVRNAQLESPGVPRFLHLDIEGHRNSLGGFDHDMFELQVHFLLGLLMPFLTEVSTPLTRKKNSRVRNLKGQDNDVPDVLAIVEAIGSIGATRN